MTYFVIWEKDRQMWWSDSCAGYAPSLLDAGAYTEDELERAILVEGEDTVMPLKEALAISEQDRSGRRVRDLIEASRNGDLMNQEGTRACFRFNDCGADSPEFKEAHESWQRAALKYLREPE